MYEMPYNLKEIEKTSWDSLQQTAAKELSTIPKSEYIVFERVFGMDWPQFERMTLSLAGKNYDEISCVHEKMAMLGDLSQNEVTQLAIIATLNKSQYKSSKIEYWQACRLLPTYQSLANCNDYAGDRSR